MDVDQIVRKAADAMPELVADLERLVAIPSIAFPGYPAEPVERMGAVALDLFQKAGFRDARLMEVPSGYPPIYAELPGPEGSPVVVLYAHSGARIRGLRPGRTTDASTGAGPPTTSAGSSPTSGPCASSTAGRPAPSS